MNVDVLRNLKIDRTIDARGAACPGPLLQAKWSLAQMRRGEILEVLSSDVGTNVNVPLWFRKVGHEHLGSVEETDFWRVFVKRMK